MSEYRPPFVFRSGHINTVYPVLFRNQPDPAYSRQRYDTPDGDFFDVDFIQNTNNRIAILCHGLEGSSQSKYIIGTAGVLARDGWDVAAINHRSCSGEMNRTIKMYHSGATWDLDFLVSQLSKRYSEISLVGFSLGGNMVLKYAGEKGSDLDQTVSAIVSVSVPLDLRAGSLNIGRLSNYFYEQKFLRSLLPKMEIKAVQYPDHIDPEDLKKCTSLYAFDDRFTGPLHGFKDADDYYAQCSGKFFLLGIQRRTLILTAMDDPFLPKECYPVEIARQNPMIEMQVTRYGGHVGYAFPGKKFYWGEERIGEFLRQV